MAKRFDPWEKDPFFSAAEEVQESADRMESIYRQWIHERKFSSEPSSALSKDLQTALGTAKWQLEELERAINLNEEEFPVAEATKSRRGQFVSAIGDRILTVENALKETNLGKGESSLSWVRLNEGERDELAQFLSGSEAETSSSNVPSLASSMTWAASAVSNDDMLEISVSSEDDSSQRTLGEQPSVLPPRVHSLSGLSSSRANSVMNWYKVGFRKWKSRRECSSKASLPLKNQVDHEMNVYSDGSKSSLTSCGDEDCEKQLGGWAGAIQRQVRRSRYQIQYGRPVQMISWSFLGLFFIVLIVWNSR